MPDPEDSLDKSTQPFGPILPDGLNVTCLPESLSFYKFIVESLPMAIIAVDSELRIAEFNPEAEKVTGFAAWEAVGRKCRDIMRGDLCDRECPLKIVVGTRKPLLGIRTTIRNKDGKSIPVRANCAALFNGKGELMGGVEAFLDISPLKALEREKANLVSMLAHDLKSSIAGIHGLGLQLLRTGAGEDREKREHYLEVMTKEASNLELLIEEFIEYSRLETGRLKLCFGTVALDKELLEIFETYRIKALQKGIRLDLHIEDSVSMIWADAQRLRRVFTNLLDNAIKYSEDGGIVILSAMEHEKGVAVTITDTGTGIGPEDLPFIFDPFHRGRTVGKREGYGLGLATVRAIMDGHKGRVEVSSVLGKGSTFIIFLPKEGSHEEDIAGRM
jgi:PAS domain S-box-containing protein